MLGRSSVFSTRMMVEWEGQEAFGQEPEGPKNASDTQVQWLERLRLKCTEVVSIFQHNIADPLCNLCIPNWPVPVTLLEGKKGCLDSWDKAAKAPRPCP